MMFRSLIFPVAASALVLGTTAIAQTYEEAAASAVPPATPAEMLECGNYWRAWAFSLDPDFYGEGSGIWSASFKEKLPAEIQLPAAIDTSIVWFEKAKAEYGDETAYNAAVEALYEYDVEALDERKFMELLGNCKRPE